MWKFYLNHYFVYSLSCCCMKELWTHISIKQLCFKKRKHSVSHVQQAVFILFIALLILMCSSLARSYSTSFFGSSLKNHSWDLEKKKSFLKNLFARYYRLNRVSFPDPILSICFFFFFQTHTGFFTPFSRFKWWLTMKETKIDKVIATGSFVSLCHAVL